jgi:serine/threonine-protein kinase RsbW/non-specific serine/threonine protein kinase
VLHRSGEVVGVLDRFTAQMASRTWPSNEVFLARLALEEALVNALCHGNGGDPSKAVRVWWKVTHDEVKAVIEDEGAGFDPALSAPSAPENRGRPSGRGLPLMRACVTSVSYNATGNQVTLRKRRTPADS